MNYLGMTAMVIFVCIGWDAAAAQGERYRTIQNASCRLGVDMESGGSVFYFSQASPRRNLLNHADRGRFIQQSYYGDSDGSMWNKKPWRWNPVQGGDWRGKPATVLESKIGPSSLYVKSRPRNWGGGEEIPETTMVMDARLSGHLARLSYTFTYTGKHRHKSRHQELPAVFVDYALPNLVYYKGDRPWTGDKLSRDVPGWPNEGRKLTECWAAYVDEKDWGIGVYTTEMEDITCYRHRGKAGPKGGGCSYFAPVKSLAIVPGFVFEYDVYLTIGTVAEIRSRFTALHHSQPMPVVSESIEIGYVGTTLLLYLLLNSLGVSLEVSVQSPFPTVPERCMSDIVSKRDCVHQIFIQAQLSGEVSGDLSHFKRMI